MTIEDIDKMEDLFDINEELADLKRDIDSQADKNKIIQEELDVLYWTYWIPKNVGLEYINILEAEFERQKKLGWDKIALPNNNYLLNKLWFGNLHFLTGLSKEFEYLYKLFGVVLFYIKKLCPKNFENIANLLITNPLFIIASDDELLDTYTWIKAENYIKQIIRFIEKNRESSYECLKVCSPSKHTDQVDLQNLDKETVEWWFRMLVIFSETFIKEPESINLMQYLMWNPQKLRNLGWKVVKEIDLDINSWINFAFRGIIEMVKSRPDLDFPHMGKSSGRKIWEQQRGKIIKEYENMLRNYISEDFDEGDKDSERNDNEKPFDKIFYATHYWDMVLDSIATPKNWVQNFTWNIVSDYSTGWKPVDKVPYTLNTPSVKNPVEWTEIEEEYKNLDSNKQILFDIGVKKIETRKYLYKMEFWNLVRREKNKKPMIYHQKAPQKEIFLNNERRHESGWSKMISDIKKYVKDHPQEKILVCIEHHWGQDWSSWNGWSKEDWIELANISPNIKIRSIRCFFWEAFSNKDIYKQQSSVSWFSNSTPTVATVSEAVNDGLKKWLWFNELEIYTRLNYRDSVTPLTENMEYKDVKTWKIQIWKVWLAQNLDESSDSGVRHA